LEAFFGSNKKAALEKKLSVESWYVEIVNNSFGKHRLIKGYDLLKGLDKGIFELLRPMILKESLFSSGKYFRFINTGWIYNYGFLIVIIIVTRLLMSSAFTEFNGDNVEILIKLWIF
jgi:hypothetical protein